MSDGKEIQIATAGAHRAAVIALACKAITIQQLAGRPIHVNAQVGLLSVARDLAMEWAGSGDPAGLPKLANEIVGEVADMIERAERLEADGAT